MVRYLGRGGQYRHTNQHGGQEVRSKTTRNQKFRGSTVELEDCTFRMHNEYKPGAKQYSDNIKKLKIYARNCTTDIGAIFQKNPDIPTVINQA